MTASMPATATKRAEDYSHREITRFLDIPETTGRAGCARAGNA